MKKTKTTALVFLLSCSIALLTVFWLSYSIHGFNLLMTEIMYKLVLALALFSVFITGFYMHRLLADIRYKINIRKEKEKNVIDYYQYCQLVNPPDMDN